MAAPPQGPGHLAFVSSAALPWSLLAPRVSPDSRPPAPPQAEVHFWGALRHTGPGSSEAPPCRTRSLGMQGGCVLCRAPPPPSPATAGQLLQALGCRRDPDPPPMVKPKEGRPRGTGTATTSQQPRAPEAEGAHCGQRFIDTFRPLGRIGTAPECWHLPRAQSAIPEGAGGCPIGAERQHRAARPLPSTQVGGRLQPRAVRQGGQPQQGGPARSGSGRGRRGLVVEHVVVVDVHEHRHRLPDDDRQPHGRVAVVAAEEAAHYPGQWDLGTRGPG